LLTRPLQPFDTGGFYVKTKSRIAVLVAIMLIIAVAVAIGCQREEAVARGPQTKIYFDQGGDRMVLKSGAVLIATPGATIAVDDLIVGDSLTINSLYPLLNGSDQKIVCGSTTITGTGTISHTLATPAVVLLTLGEDMTGKNAHLTFTNASATVTVKVWDTALTPVASDTGADVQWCVIGTP